MNDTAPWQEAGVWIAGLLLVVGMIGIVVPVLPGLLICLGAVLIWAIMEGSTTGWITFAVAALFFLGGVSLQFLVPGRRMRDNGVGLTTMLAAVVAAIIGFFVVPVIGAPIGFVLGILAVEWLRSRDHAHAWDRTKLALGAVLQSIGIELAAAFAIAVTFVVGVLFS